MIDGKTIKEVIDYARNMDCDLDGDIITYKGKKYYVHIFKDIVKEIPD